MDPCPVLVGRQQEMTALRQLLDAGGGVAVISGEAGIGKSRLVREFAAEAAQRGRVVLWGRPEEVAQPGPYALVADLLESIAERGGPKVKRQARELVADLLHQSEPDQQRSAPTARALAAEIRGLVAQLGAPPLVVLEDMHWADDSSHSVILNLARSAQDDSRILVATLRAEGAVSEQSLTRLLDALLRDRAALWTRLAPLREEDAAQMIEILKGEPLQAGELSEIGRLGEGIPFLIEELVTAKSQGGNRKLPLTIEQSVQARLKMLGAETERVVQTASLLAGAADVPVLAHACDLTDGDVAECLVYATRAGLLTDSDGRLMFRHGLMRDAIAAGLISVEAQQLHARLAAAIEKVHLLEMDAFAAALARHFHEAGDFDSAAQYAFRAGERALALGATTEARAAFTLAVSDGGSLTTEAQRGLAEVEFREGNEAAAADLFRAVAEDFKERGDTVQAAQALGRLAWARQDSWDPADVIAVLDEALGLVASDTEPVEFARLMVQKGSFLVFAFGEAARSQPILTDALEVAHASREYSVVAEALDGLAKAAASMGSLEDALRLGAEATEAAKRSNRTESIGRTHNNRAVFLALGGHGQAALEVLAEGRNHLIHTYGRAAVAAIDVTQAWIMWVMGLPADVANLTARGRFAWQRWRGYRWLLDIWAAVELGDRSVARARAREALLEVAGGQSISEVSSDPQQASFEAIQVILAHAIVERANGNAVIAVRLTERLALLEDSRIEPLDFAQLLSERAFALVDVGDVDQALSTSLRLSELSAQYEYPYLAAISREVDGVLALASGRVSEAEFFLNDAVERFAASGNSLDRARSMRLLSEARLRVGDSSNTQPVIGRLREAREIAAECGAAVELNRIDAVLRSVGVRPRAGRPRRKAGSAGDSELSPRESEIAALVAVGDTNADIAARLFLSERTVEDHISKALKKLSLSGRAALASWAVRQGMI